MKVTSRAKAEIIRYTDALHVFNHGDHAAGEKALQIADLTHDQVKLGLTERLKRAVNEARARHMRIPAHVLNMADRVLADSTMVKVAPPTVRTAAEEIEFTIQWHLSRAMAEAERIDSTVIRSNLHLLQQSLKKVQKMISSQPEPVTGS